VTPEDPDHPEYTRSKRTSSFLLEQGCQLAINAAPVEPRVFLENQLTDIIGLAINKGQIYSKPVKKNGALLVDNNGTVRLQSAPFDISDTELAVPGYQLVLYKGRNFGSTRKREPRTLAGLDTGAQYLYLLVIDGLNARHSIGATTHESAAWIQALGADTALNLDGGGSVTMVIPYCQPGPQLAFSAGWRTGRRQPFRRLCRPPALNVYQRNSNPATA
jgi:hypothetical protein